MLFTRSDSTAFLLGALAGAGCLAGAACTYRYSSVWWREQAARAKRANGSLHSEASDKPAAPAVSVADALNDEILSEQFTRNRQFFGDEGQRGVHKAFVIVVGLGGVGSHAAHILLRAGVGRLRLIDFDQVSLSSLNRHAVATRADVGLPKATVLKDHFACIVPEADVEAHRSMFTADKAETLLAGRPDVVIDAIDDISTKVALLVACRERGLHVVCACGAGAKADPSRVSIADISEASCDPLARKVRHLLRARHGIETGIPMVLSPERPRCGLIPVEQLSHAPHELQDKLAIQILGRLRGCACREGNGRVVASAEKVEIVPDFRIRTVPVLGTTPAVFGMAAASWALCRLAGQPLIPQPIFYVTEDDVERLLERLAIREDVVFGSRGPLALDKWDASFLARDIWRAKSARALGPGPQGAKALCRFLDGLHFTRWDKDRTATVDNLVLLTEEEADVHDAASLKQLRAEEPRFVAGVEAVLATVRLAFGIDLPA